MERVTKPKRKVNKMKCSVCGKEGAYIRLKTKEIVCKNCGEITPPPPKKEKEATS